MRLFVGIDIPDKVKENLDELIGILRPTSPLRWSATGNFHITTKFIGQWPEERLAEMKAALAAVRNEAIPIVIGGLGWFPNPHHPRVFWAAVRAPESLAALAAKTEDAAFALGIAKEKRAFSPHLTLARIEDQPDLAELRRRVASLPSGNIGEFTATEFHLYLSQPMPGGSVYTKLASFPLT